MPDPIRLVRPLERKIGVLAYGSLISDPGAELKAVISGEALDVVTPFAVEFARSSDKRCGAPTLVPVDTGGRPIRARIFEVSVDEREAMDIVYRREINDVGSAKPFVERPASWKNAVRFDRFKNFEGFSVVISTRMPPNIPSPTPTALADLAIASAKQLSNGRDGISYLLNAKAYGIETALSAKYEQEILARTGTGSLNEALDLLRPRSC